MNIQARYKAQTGTYISVVPAPEDYAYLMSFLNIDVQDGRVSVPADLHCTLMYAPNSVLTPEQQLAILSRSNTFFAATAVRVTSWVGADNDSYVVLELESSDLVAFNKMLESEFGLKPTFDEYRPHITLVSGLPAMISKTQAIEPRKIHLHGLRIEDAKG